MDAVAAPAVGSEATAGTNPLELFTSDVSAHSLRRYQPMVAVTLAVATGIVWDRYGPSHLFAGADAVAGAQIRQWIVDTPFPDDLRAAVSAQFEMLARDNPGASFAVRSSATAEDLPDASFAGQQETFLNMRGPGQRAARDQGGRSLRCTTTAPFPTACTRASPTPMWRCRPACSAWCAPTWARPASCSRIDTESGFRDVVFVTVLLRPGRNGGAGRGQPGRVLRAQAHAGCRQVRGGPPQHRLEADQDDVRDRKTAGQSVNTVDVAGSTTPPLLAQRRGSDGTGALRSDYRSTTTAVRWTSSGARTASTASCTSCRRARRRCSRASRGQGRAALPPTGDRAKYVVLAAGRAIGHKIGAGAVRVVQLASEMARIKAGDISSPT